MFHKRSTSHKISGSALALILLVRLLWLAAIVLPDLAAQGAVVFTTLYSFTGTNDGANPFSGSLVQGSDGNLYGTTWSGGTNGFGTVFRISTNGVFTSLHSFTGGNDGGDPQAGLTKGRDGYFYGATILGGTNGLGTVFRVGTNGLFTSLYSFTGGTNGAEPESAPVQGSDGNLYGTTCDIDVVGPPAAATVFKLSTNGVLTILHSFPFASNGQSVEFGLVQGSDGDFYGTTLADGTNGWGTVYRISPDGAFTKLYSFGSLLDTNGAPLDGGHPYGWLVQGKDGDFYGTTFVGGKFGEVVGWSGTVFKITTNGALTTLHSFSHGNGGASPRAGLVLGRDGNFYGTTDLGGTNDDGTIFVISTNGAFASLYSFTGGKDGEEPAGLVQGSDGSFYGTTFGVFPDGSNNLGTVFRLTVVPEPPTLTIEPFGTNVVLMWSTQSAGSDYTGFNLQSATNLVSPDWTPVSQAPLIVNGLNAVTNPVTGEQQFFRLSQ